MARRQNILMNKNSLYRDLTTFGSQYVLKRRMDDASSFVDWTEENFDYVRYNPRKENNRFGTLLPDVL